MKTSIVISLSVCFAALTLSAQVAPPDHFQCYSVLFADPAVAAPGTVSLFDQFNLPATDVKVERVVGFCNPARKIHRNQAYGVNDRLRHLTLYATYPQAQPARVVSISNQFGKEKLRLGNAILLAVPTNKNNEGQPGDLDHYRCYAARGKAIDDRVGLGDQFEPKIQGHIVMDPVAFCNPVEKQHVDTNGNTSVTPIRNPDLHLACYSMTRTPMAASATIENQFGRHDIEVGPPDALCVPTRKLGWEQLPDVSVPVPGNPRLTASPAAP